MWILVSLTGHTSFRVAKGGVAYETRYQWGGLNNTKLVLGATQ